MTPHGRSLLAAALAAAVASHAHAGHDVTLMRPLVADPRENQFRMKWVASTEDWRYGTDITDPASRGGVVRGRESATWDVGIGSAIKLGHDTHVGPWRWWERVQVIIPAGIFASFDRSGGELVNADYQFGGALDILWTRGRLDPNHRVVNFDVPVWTSRVMLYHRSTHVGDEYLSFGRFGTNQTGHPDEGKLFGFPPVKRVNLSFESWRFLHSAEWAPWRRARATLRAYGGLEKKINPLGIRQPRAFQSVLFQAGAEFRSSGNDPAPEPRWPLTWWNRVLPRIPITGEWFAAIDVKLARPFDFSRCDNPAGSGEVWTPHLWSSCPHGREQDFYAGSWHAVAGAAIYPQEHRMRGEHRGLISPAVYLTLDWYRGYSPNGQFLDQRFRYRPLGFVAPGITIHF